MVVFNEEEKQLHPYAPQRKRSQHQPSRYTGEPTNQTERDLHTDEVESEHTNSKRTVNNHIHREEGANSTKHETIYPRHQEPLSAISKLTQSLKKNKTWVIFTISMVIFLLSIFSIKNDVIKVIHFFNDDKDIPIVVGTTQLDEKEGSGVDEEKAGTIHVTEPEDVKAEVSKKVTSTDTTKSINNKGMK